jgi:hypothetical protein
MQGAWPGNAAEKGQLPSLRFRFVHPGAIVPRDAIAAKPLPANTSIVIRKEGDKPIQITVKQGDKSWEVTEKELDKLPADVRPHVEQMLGKGPLGILGGLSSSDFVPEMMGQSAGDPRVEKRLNEMNRRMDQMMKNMEELMGGRQPNAPPAKEPENGSK